MIAYIFQLWSKAFGEALWACKSFWLELKASIQRLATWICQSNKLKPRAISCWNHWQDLALAFGSFSQTSLQPLSVRSASQKKQFFEQLFMFLHHFLHRHCFEGSTNTIGKRKPQNFTQILCWGIILSPVHFGLSTPLLSMRNSHTNILLCNPLKDANQFTPKQTIL